VQVGVHEAKSRLSELLRAVASGQEVEILRSGRPVAKLVPYAPRQSREMGTDAGRVTIADDFDAALPDAVLDSFYA
jgi:prevent-host-death family protein